MLSNETSRFSPRTYLVGGAGDLDGLAILDEVLAHLVGLEAGDDGEFPASIDNLAGAVEVGVAQTIWVVVAAVSITAAGEAVLGVGSPTPICLADVVLVGLTWVRGQSVRVRVRLPVLCELLAPQFP
jgi:hypothetical protein